MKVVTYSRVSTSHHEQKPEIQVNECRRFCSNKEWQIEKEIIDHGYSGSNGNRPGFRELMSQVEQGLVDVVVVVKMDRLFRSLKHLVVTLEKFEKKGVKFVAIKDNVDYSTPTGRLFVQILGSLAEFERSLLLERTLMGLEHAKANGKKFGRPQKHDPKKILFLREQGLSYRQIQKKLNVPMGTIAQAIKDAQKSGLSIDCKPAAQKTTVLRAPNAGITDKKHDESDSVRPVGTSLEPDNN
ncbi:MAG: recombinase family protein [Bdellovibrionaceae bacterium]|nr:recombinase family protein [Pseudobdellovibrionaceae bacterium]